MCGDLLGRKARKIIQIHTGDEIFPHAGVDIGREGFQIRFQIVRHEETFQDFDGNRAFCSALACLSQASKRLLGNEPFLVDGNDVNPARQFS